MMTQRSLWLGLAVVFLASCGSNQAPNAALTVLRSAISEVLPGRDAPQPDLRSQITPQAVAETPNGVIYANFLGLEADAILVPAGLNGSVRSWATADASTLALDRGVLTATRGIQVDLTSADLSEAKQGIFGNRQQGVRIHRYVDANEQTVIRSFVCDYTRQRGTTGQTLIARFAATLVTEDCTDSDGAGFINRYWLDSAGTVRKSEQWISAALGSVEIELLKSP